MTEPAGERRPRRRPPADSARGGAARPRSGERAGSPAARSPDRPAKGARVDPARSRAARRSTGTAEKAGAAKATLKKDAATKEKPPARERPQPERGTSGQWPMPVRSVLPSVLGIPPVAAVGLAAALTAIGVIVDLTWVGNLSTVFTACHIAGCVVAVCWVRRSGLFGPMVQPPLLVAATVPVFVLASGPPRPGQGVAEQLLVIGAPLVNAFPVMAWTTGIVLVLGLARIVFQRPDRD
jgi:hypothetical protein